jgi:hypothetical protein
MPLPTDILQPEDFRDNDLKPFVEASRTDYRSIGDEYYEILVRDLVYPKDYVEDDLTDPVPMKVRWVLRAKVGYEICKDSMTKNLVSTLDGQTLSKSQWELKMDEYEQILKDLLSGLDAEAFVDEPKGESATLTHTFLRR